MASHQSSILAWLDSLEPFFVAPDDAPEDAGSIVQPVLELRPVLRREERRITFFGAFKAGKSSLLNAVIGAPLLPARAHRTAGSVATIRYGAPPRVELVRRGADGPVTEAVAFDHAAAAILEGGDIEEVLIAVPHPLLGHGCTLVDTPGLLDDEELTARSRREIERSDLAVMVLSADKILSSQERVLAAWANELLHGNVAFAVNRLDMVDEEDRQEVLDWAGAALRDTGNNLIGSRGEGQAPGPRVFATAARGSELGVAELTDWLEQLFTTGRGDRVAALSRLGLLIRRLAEAGDRIHTRLAEARERTRQAQQANLERLAREKVTIKREVAQARKRLEVARANLKSAGEEFVTWCVRDTRQTVRPGMQGPIYPEVEGAAEDYAEAVTEEFAAALAGLPLTVPAFVLSDWIFRGKVDPVTHPFTQPWAIAGDLASRVLERGDEGRETGAAVGGWIGKNVFGIDVERETIKRIEAGARAALESIQTEVDAYVTRLGELLDQVDRFYDEWSHPSPELTVAEETEQCWAHLFHWCEGFQHAVRATTREIEAGP